MSYSEKYKYRFNGVISTDKTVMQNLEAMTNAAGSWLTYDIHTGKWSVVINKPGDSTVSFDDSNIIGSISVTGTGLLDLYNSVRAEFPHIDLNDQTDFIMDEIPDQDRNPNEPDNTLVLQYDILNEPVQAELLGLLELKQSRVDKLVKFATDYSNIGVKAGDIIDLTSEIHGFVNKKFRVISCTESDSDDGSILINISAMEYDDNVYSADDLYRYTRTNNTGIVAIGALAAPTTPEITKFEKDAQPRVILESTVTLTSINSVVEGVEFWYSADQNNYYLVGVDRPTNDSTFTSGEVAELTWTTAPTGNVWVKARCVNSATTGPFSNVAALIYNPVQVPNVVDNTTTVEDDNGDNVLGMLGLAAALALLNGLINGESGPGTIIGDANLVTGGGTYDGTWMGAKRYVSTTEPTGSFNSGDVWFKI